MKVPGTIRFWRRTAQTAAFVVLVYGAYLARGLAPTAGVKATFSRADAVYWAPKQPSVVDVYVPSAVCKFNPQGGLAAACPVYFVNDKLTWLIPLQYLLGYVLVFFLLGLLLSRLWCGWVCPLGSISDALNWARRRLGLRHLDFTERFRRTLSVAKYSLLGLSVLISGIIAVPALQKYQCYFFLPFCQLCPGRILFPLFDGTIPKVTDFSALTPAVFTVLAWSFFGLFLAGSLLGRRVWCRLCPIGACHEFFNRGGLVALKKEPLKCNRCGICAVACPVEYRGVYEEKIMADISHRDCILCLRCVEMCPKSDCLQLTFLGKRLAGSSFKEAGG